MKTYQEHNYEHQTLLYVCIMFRL